jgi:hypothetical protein
MIASMGRAVRFATSIIHHAPIAIGIPMPRISPSYGKLVVLWKLTETQIAASGSISWIWIKKSIGVALSPSRWDASASA